MNTNNLIPLVDEFIRPRYQDLFAAFLIPSLQSWLSLLPAQMNAAFAIEGHGDWRRWREVLQTLPLIKPLQIDLQSDWVRVTGGEEDPLELELLLRQLHPWRKGPYDIHGVQIDTEWRSDLKWGRVQPHLRSLSGKIVLDVGCGNGYYAWRMIGAGARRVIGVDPTLLSVAQFLAIKHFMGDFPVHVIPVGIEEIPPNLQAFDTVFSMGVLYHRRSPLDHLLELKGCLRPGGELVLETLVIDGDCGQVLVPEDRYARMRNVWFIPSCATLLSWLKRCGYQNVRLVDVTQTTMAEQRSTEWMTFQSLPDFLAPENQDLTVEGLPAPKRAIFLADSP
jgi:tRNA (mo5U34)-methyltransferase